MGHQEIRRTRLEPQIIQIATALPADLQHVAKSGRGQQPNARPLALQHRVGRNRRAMHEARDRRRRHTMLVRQLADRRSHRDIFRSAARRDLQDPQRARFIRRHNIGECAADIDADLIAAACHGSSDLFNRAHRKPRQERAASLIRLGQMECEGGAERTRADDHDIRVLQHAEYPRATSYRTPASGTAVNL